MLIETTFKDSSKVKRIKNYVLKRNLYLYSWYKKSLSSIGLIMMTHRKYLVKKSQHSLHKKWIFPLRISSVNVTKSGKSDKKFFCLKKSLMENFTFCAVMAEGIVGSCCYRHYFQFYFFKKGAFWTHDMNFVNTLDILKQRKN